MKISFAAVIAAALTLSGCVTLPKGGPIIPIAAQDIYTAVDCEVALLRTKTGLNGLDNWTGLLNLVVTRTGQFDTSIGLDAKVTVATPVAPVTLTAKPSGGYNDKLVGSITLKRAYAELSSAQLASCPSSGGSTGMGLASTLNDRLAFASSDPHQAGIVGLTFDRTFTVTRGVGGGLTFTAGIISVTTTNSNSVSDQVVTKITFGINPPEPKKPKARVLEDIQKRLDNEQTNQLLENLQVPANT